MVPSSLSFFKLVFLNPLEINLTSSFFVVGSVEGNTIFIKKYIFKNNVLMCIYGGETGIRTLGTR